MADATAVGPPTDRALLALGRPFGGCSAYADGYHQSACPGSRGMDDDLPVDAAAEAAPFFERTSS